MNLFAGALICSAAPVYVNAVGYVRNAGDIRKLKMNNSELANILIWYIAEVNISMKR